jgi:hypothetical protein
MAYGVDEYPDPPESPSGHYDWEYDADCGCSMPAWVDDEDEEPYDDSEEGGDW